MFITHLCVYILVCNMFYRNGFSIHVATNFKNIDIAHKWLSLIEIHLFKFGQFLQH